MVLITQKCVLRTAHFCTLSECQILDVTTINIQLQEVLFYADA